MTRETQELGRRGEREAEAMLVKNGARVLARNFRTASGELDLVVLHEDDLVGVEVKTRRPGQPALPEEAVTGAKLRRLERVLARFAQDAGQDQRSWRIDVVAIEVTAAGAIARIEHIRDAFA